MIRCSVGLGYDDVWTVWKEVNEVWLCFGLWVELHVVVLVLV